MKQVKKTFICCKYYICSFASILRSPEEKINIVSHDLIEEEKTGVGESDSERAEKLISHIDYAIS